MVTSLQVSWLFFKARAKHPYLSHTGRASNAEKQPTGAGPEGCYENGRAAALLVGHVSIQICSLLAPCRRPILIATIYLLFRGQDTRVAAEVQDPCAVSYDPRGDIAILKVRRYARSASPPPGKRFSESSDALRPIYWIDGTCTRRGTNLQPCDPKSLSVGES